VRVNDALILVRLGLASVFVVAGLAKVFDRRGSRRALEDFNIPQRLVGTFVVLLPMAELATAGAMLFAATARIGGAAALVLLAVFVVGLIQALRRGQAPDCHCFGQVHSEPASWLTVARNTALALPAAYLAGAGPGPSLVAWVDGHTEQALGLIATSSLATVATVTAVALWRQNVRLRSTQAWTPPPPLRIGSRAPSFSLASVGGGAVTLNDLLVDDRPCLLTFVSPGCGPCAALLPEIARWYEALGDRLLLPVVSAGEAGAADDLAREHRLAQVLSDADATVSRDYGVPGTPCSVLIESDGTVGSAPATGQLAIEALVRVALQRARRPALVIHGAR
jgi:peroxiredoxin